MHILKRFGKIKQLFGDKMIRTKLNSVLIPFFLAITASLQTPFIADAASKADLEAGKAFIETLGFYFLTCWGLSSLIILGLRTIGKQKEFIPSIFFALFFGLFAGYGLAAKGMIWLSFIIGILALML